MGHRIVCPVCARRIDVPAATTDPPTIAPAPELPAPGPAEPGPAEPGPPTIASEPTPSEPVLSSPLPETPQLSSSSDEEPVEGPLLPPAIATNEETHTLFQAPVDEVEAPITTEIPDLSEILDVPETPVLSEIPKQPNAMPIPAPVAESVMMSEATRPSFSDDVPGSIIIDTSEPDVPRAHATSQRPELSRAQYYSVVMLALASIVIAIFCIAPSIVEQRLARQFGVRAPDIWSYVVILLATVQIAMSVFAIRVPDWSSVWLLTLMSTCVAAVYAAGLALTMFAGIDHELVRQLGLLDEVGRHRVQPWCFFVVSLALILAFACGRYSTRWYHADLQVAASRQP